MFAIVGLGNPEARYQATRHNAGFNAVSRLFSELESRGLRLAWKDKFNCKFLKASLCGREVLLVLPLLYMNRSGEACVPLLNFYKISPESLVVVHDDLDLMPGAIKVSLGGGAGGHGGVKDLIEMLGSAEFCRVRIGIGHPLRQETAPAGFPEDVQRADVGSDEREEVVDWVLGVPEPVERKLLDSGVELAVEAVKLLLTEGVQAAQRRFNRRESRALKEASDC